jgi:DNA-binding XRE family transcriptional regulator
MTTTKETMVPSQNRAKPAELTTEQRARVEAIRARRRTPEAQAEIEEVRRRFADHPSREELIRRGDIDPERTSTGDGRLALIHVMAELKRLRAERGLSLADLADRCGIDRAAISRLESGKNPNPTFETVARYAAAMGARVRILVEEG